ncbi:MULTISPECIES: DUF1292 domain-containing protein [Gudongella]|jgi:uncharacterized protein YrzB (UPF0473 family)|uniref:DUF1292 domain-containing protein n=1 Tax=Gudongella oleilytica TaxID=1582259 RepID=UPI000FF8A152|nr:DUF1292 domain-containing protein [Gudongella oleilytica]MDY0255694.1 DUF1292 domain-containing protein [Gudongella oleilytica]
MTEKHVFYDELGNEIEFLVKAKFSLDDTDYVALLNADQLDTMTYLLKLELDQDGEPIFVTIDDEEEFEEVKSAYEELSREHLQ